MSHSIFCYAGSFVAQGILLDRSSAGRGIIVEKTLMSSNLILKSLGLVCFGASVYVHIHKHVYNLHIYVYVCVHF